MTTEQDLRAFEGVRPSASPLVAEVGAMHAARPTPPRANPPGVPLVEPGAPAPFDVLAVMAANAAREQAAAVAEEAARLAALPPPYDTAEIVFPVVPDTTLLEAWVGDLERAWARLEAGRVTAPDIATTYVPKPPDTAVVYRERSGHKEVDVLASVLASIAAQDAYEASLAEKPRFIPKPRPPVAGYSGPGKAIAHLEELLVDLRKTMADATERYTGVARKFSGEITDYFRAVEKARTDYQDGFIDAAEQRALADDERLRAAVDAEHDRVTTLARAEKEGIR